MTMRPFSVARLSPGCCASYGWGGSVLSFLAAATAVGDLDVREPHGLLFSAGIG